MTPSFGSLLAALTPPSHMNDVRRNARVMEPLEAESSDQVQITIPRWVYNRIAVLLIAAQGGVKVEDYIVAVLEGHARKLNL